MEHWIWLPAGKYPDRQKTKLSCMIDGESNYSVAEFRREYDFGGREIARAHFRVSGDTAFILFADGAFLFRGPAGVGGDFLYNEVLRPEFYATDYELTGEACPALRRGVLPLSALVRMGSVRICEYSRGAGGFLLEGKVYFADGGEEEIYTDETWSAQLLTAYDTPCEYHGENAAEEPVVPEKKTPPVATVTAPIPPCEEYTLPLADGGSIRIAEEKRVERAYSLERTYACYIKVSVKTAFPVRVSVTGSELPGNCDWSYGLNFTQDAVFYSMELQSVGEARVTVEKETDAPCEVRLELRASHYPAPLRAKTVTSDEALNAVTEICAHSLKYCRQTIHLDSPRHCEPLACTGDYYIETLMTAFTFGDLRLAEFDLHRTANLLRQHDGEMFHTTYSLIWVLMLWDVYRLTGKTELLRQNADALALLLRRFAGYVGENGLIETPPNYMFIDWLNPDGINLHHPPKALGQTCMCMFYYGALKTAEKIYSALGETENAAAAKEKSAALREAVLRDLWDAQRELFFEGLNTPTPEKMIYHYMPQNVSKRYYRKHANILAAYFGFFDEEENRALLRRIVDDDALGEVQPYFQHFLLDAVYRCGLREEYTLKLLDQWKAPVAECPKGLPEGFYKPTPDYSFDCSHAWAGTPAYALPLAISGLKMIEPGFRKISLSPSSLGLESASAEIPTPYGMIRVSVKKDGASEIDVPEGIDISNEK
ncbi:MAG: hypothetical protein IK118_01285 [Clostridia bacterium]|nr:hypothetical protein [Clostridia bacterium]